MVGGVWGGGTFEGGAGGGIGVFGAGTTGGFVGGFAFGGGVLADHFVRVGEGLGEVVGEVAAGGLGGEDAVDGDTRGGACPVRDCRGRNPDIPSPTRPEHAGSVPSTSKHETPILLLKSLTRLLPPISSTSHFNSTAT